MSNITCCEIEEENMCSKGENPQCIANYKCRKVANGIRNRTELKKYTKKLLEKYFSKGYVIDQLSDTSFNIPIKPIKSNNYLRFYVTQYDKDKSIKNMNTLFVTQKK